MIFHIIENIIRYKRNQYNKKFITKKKRNNIKTYTIKENKLNSNNPNKFKGKIIRKIIFQKQ